jgi:dolichol-phosphate mannosyltransferase
MEPVYDLTVIIPTFNERENIEAIIPAVEEVLTRAGIRGEILVVDDSSTDGTIPLVRALANTHPDLRLVVRSSDPGLSQSVVEGISLARAGVIQVIDADFSHPPELIPRFFGEIRGGADVVIGSRYLPGGGVEAWPVARRIISRGATALTRVFLPDLTDAGGNFFALRKEVVKGALLRPRGYKILFEILCKGRWQHVREIPYVFRDRKAGSSKLTVDTARDYLGQLADISFCALAGREGVVWKEWRKALSFGLVGLSGLFVNMGLLVILTVYGGLYYLLSSVIAIEVSILNNFLWNDRLALGGSPEYRKRPFLKRLGYFHAGIAGGAAINWLVLLLLTQFGGIHYLISNLAGILAGFIWNRLGNRDLTRRGY